MTFFANQKPSLLNWYWIDSKGRIFSSSKNALVTAFDPGYLAFIAVNGKASPWPTDTNGVQSAAALQAVISYYFPTFVINPTITP